MSNNVYPLPADEIAAMTFKGLQPNPDTQVSILIFGGIVRYVMKKVYNVFIGLANDAVVKLSDKGNIPTFLERVSEGRAEITFLHPDAQLHGVLAHPPFGGSVSTPEDLSNMTVICTLDDGNFATVSTIGYSDFGPVTVRQGLLDGLQAMESIEMRADQADFLMKAQVWRAPYTGRSLDYSILPGNNTEPCHTFDTVFVGTQVRLGVNTGRANAIGQGLPSNEASNKH